MGTIEIKHPTGFRRTGEHELEECKVWSQAEQKQTGGEEEWSVCLGVGGIFLNVLCMVHCLNLETGNKRVKQWSPYPWEFFHSSYCLFYGS
jgi:hypothetical protein